MQLEIVDPDNHLAKQKSVFAANVEAAVDEWAQVIHFSAPLKIQVKIAQSGEGRFEGASRTTSFVETIQQRKVFEEGAAYKLRTGKSALPNEPDVLITVSPEYLKDEVWMDPTPKTKSSPVPKNKVDLASLLKHEIGHAIGFHSFRDLKTRELPSEFMGVLDKYTVKKDGKFFFVGVEAKKIYGAPVPLTSTIQSQNFGHYGNADESKILVGGLMSGVVIHYGQRYQIGDLDLAILKDLGLPLRSKLPRLKFADVN
jgi:hypothetical protein